MEGGRERERGRGVHVYTSLSVYLYNAHVKSVYSSKPSGSLAIIVCLEPL